MLLAMTIASSSRELSARVPPQPKIPDHAHCQRQTKRNGRAETHRGDIQYSDGKTKSDQAPAAIGDHRRGWAPAYSRVQDQHHAGKHHGKEPNHAPDALPD